MIEWFATGAPGHTGEAGEKMTRRRLVLAALLLLMLGAAASVWFAAPSMNGGVNPETYGRIEKGMTEAEVEQVLNGPAGDYETRVNWGFFAYRRRYMNTWSPAESTPTRTRYCQAMPGHGCPLTSLRLLRKRPLSSKSNRIRIRTSRRNNSRI